jgi:polar amino acid transport system substrate-binding protein
LTEIDETGVGMVWTRRQLLRSSVGLGVLASGTAVLSACADAVAGSPRAVPTTASVPSSPTRGPAASPPLTVAVANGAPYAFNDKATGKITGQVVEVARAVLRKLGLEEVRFILTEFEQLLPRLRAKQADLVGGLYLDKSICQGALWSVPDHVGLTAFAVPAGNPKGITTFADVIKKGATVTTMRGVPEERYAARVGVPAAKLKTLVSPIEMVDAVADGKADCAAFNDIALRSIINGRPGKLEVTAGFPLDGAEILANAFAFRLDTEPELIEAFNAQLTQLHESGEWLRLAQPFGFSQANLPPADLTTEKICG